MLKKEEIANTSNNPYKALKNKVNENTRLKKLAVEEKKEISKEEIKLIKKANKIPKGKKVIQNETNNILEVNNLSKIYVTGKTIYQALKKISFKIKKGDFVVIFGESGSGKSTLLNVISGLDRPTQGDIVINNTNLSALSDAELTTFRRNYIGFVFQSYNLLLELNVWDNAKLGQQLQLEANKQLSMQDLFNRVGLTGLEKKAIDELSGGQLQRVSIVRALAKNPAIIFADEPTGALDTKTSKKVIELFKEINQKYKTTIILVTHDQSISKYANKIIYVEDGKINVQD